jgi:hypothetical protein
MVRYTLSIIRSTPQRWQTMVFQGADYTSHQEPETLIVFIKLPFSRTLAVVMVTSFPDVNDHSAHLRVDPPATQA